MKRKQTSSEHAAVAVTTTLVRGCLIVTLPTEIAGGLDRVQSVALDGLQAAAARAAVLELSAVRFMDLTEFEGIRTLSNMLCLLGARCIIVGVRPGVVAWLIGNDVMLDGLEFAQDLESALERLGVVEHDRKGGA